MDAYKRLKIEFNGIKDVIDQYTSNGNIINLLNQLTDLIDEGNGEGIIYCLEEIDKWYSDNISVECGI